MFQWVAICLLALSVSNLAGAASATDFLDAAIRAGDLSRVQTLVESGAEINVCDDLGNTPLLYAVMGKRAAIASYLLKHHADVNYRHASTGYTALDYAVVSDDSELAGMLLAAGADSRLQAPSGLDPLHLSVLRNATTAAGMLLQAGAPVDSLDAHDDTPLDVAVRHGRLQMTTLLLRAGADIRRVHSADGRSALHLAAIQGSAKLILLLAEAGADSTLPDRWEQTPLDLALAYKNPAAIAAFLSLADKNQKLQNAFDEAMERAVVRGRTETASMLISAGWDVNRPTLERSSYLNDAALKGQLKTAKLLLDRGARVDVRNCDGGATPLMLAVELNHVEAAAVLLQRGANPLLKDAAGRTALDRAADVENPALRKLLEAAITPESHG